MQGLTKHTNKLEHGDLVKILETEIWAAVDHLSPINGLYSQVHFTNPEYASVKAHNLRLWAVADTSTR